MTGSTFAAAAARSDANDWQAESGSSAEQRRAVPRTISPSRLSLERLLRDHSIPLAAMVSMGLVVASIADASRSLSACAVQQRVFASVRAELAAEEAAFAAAESSITGGRSFASSWGMTVHVERVRETCDRLDLAVAPRRGVTVRFACDWLAGSAPACLGRRLSLAAGMESLSSTDWLRGAEGGSADAMAPLAVPEGAAKTLPGLSCDSEVAFLHLPGGTDRPDYTLGTGLDQVAPAREVEVVEVRGNLWVLPAPRPLRFHLRGPLTVVVRGNVYLERSLEVTGRGPLTLVAHRTGPTFRDLDGDGACSPGEPVMGGPGNPAIEGDGSLYLGLPRQATRAPLALAPHLVAGGEIHVSTSVVMHGALVGQGLTRCRDDVHLELTGNGLSDVARSKIPGFATHGDPRPGLLEPVAGSR